MPNFFQSIAKGVKGGLQKANRFVRSVGKRISKRTKRLFDTVRDTVGKQVKTLETVGDVIATDLLQPATKRIPRSVRNIAQFADDAYYPSRRSSKFGYIYKPKLSNLRKVVWIKPGDNNTPNTYFISYRGTSLIDPEDYKSDFEIIKGTEEDLPRVKRGIKEVTRLVRAGNKVNITGHSLGGGIVMQIIRQLPSDVYPNVKGYAYDPGVASVQIGGSSPPMEHSLYIYRTKGDPISVAARSFRAKKNVTYEPKDPTSLPHRLEQLL